MSVTFSHDIETEAGKMTVKAEHGYGDVIEIIVQRDGVDVIFRLIEPREALELGNALTKAAQSLISYSAAAQR